MRTAVIAGASGLVGGHCLRGLVERYDRVISLGRRKVALEHPRLEQRVLDLGALEPFVDLRGADVFCTLGTTIAKAGSQKAFRHVDFDFPVRLAEIAAEAGAKSSSVVSSVGADARSSNFYLRVKGEMENAVCATPLAGVYIFRPSFLMGERSEPRLGERVALAAAPLFTWMLVGCLRKYRPTPAERVAQAMIEAAEHGAPGRFVYHMED